MVVVIAVAAQHLVDGQGIGLMAVVIPSGGGADDDSPSVGHIRQFVVHVGTKVGVDLLDDSLPPP